MRLSLLASLCAAWIALPLSARAAEPVSPFSMTGVADNGDTVELHFDGAPSRSATLVIKGDKTGFAPKSFPCSYEIEPVPRGALESPIVKITLADRQIMTIACDPLSDNCHASGYPTVNGTSFSILWQIKRAPAKTLQARSTASK
jgi:hypothetical protein